MKFSIIASLMVVGIEAYQYGSFCDNAAFYVKSCVSARTSCNGSCPVDDSAKANQQAHCQVLCDACTMKKVPSTLGAAYSSCMGKASTCPERQSCAWIFNNGVTVCLEYIDSAAKDGGSLGTPNCGAKKQLPSC